MKHEAKTDVQTYFNPRAKILGRPCIQKDNEIKEKISGKRKWGREEVPDN